MIARTDWFPTHRHGLATAALWCLLAVAPAIAQVAPGWSAIARGIYGAGPGNGGITLLDTWAPGAPTLGVTGLPPGLTGASSQGCSSIAIEVGGNRLIAGEKANLHANALVHVLTLSGSTVVADDAYFVAGGVNGDYSAIVDIEPFGDGYLILCSTALATTGPMAGHILGMFRPDLGPPGTAGVIVPVPIAGLAFGRPTDLAVDVDGGFLYVVQEDSSPWSRVHRLALPGSGVPLVATSPPWETTSLSGLLRSVAVGSRGEVFVASDFSCVRLDEVAGQVVQTFAGTSARDQAVVASTGDRLQLASVHNLITLITPSLMLNTLGAIPTDSLRIDYRGFLEVYRGPGQPVATAYRWLLGPNPGGSPTLGNSAFSLTIEQSPSSLLGVAALALGEAVTPLPTVGVNLLVDPASAVVGPLLTAAATATVPLPIPSQPALLGSTVFVQTLHWQGTGWGASPGLRVHLTL